MSALESISIRILNIKDIEFFVDETLDSVLQAEVSIEQSLRIDIPTKTFEIILTVSFLNNNYVFMRGKTSNTFEILEMDQLIPKDENDKIDLPEDTLAIILGLSLSHTRALMAKNGAGTKFSNILLPILDPKVVAKDLFN